MSESSVGPTISDDLGPESRILREKRVWYYDGTTKANAYCTRSVLWKPSEKKLPYIHIKTPIYPYISAFGENFRIAHRRHALQVCDALLEHQHPTHYSHAIFLRPLSTRSPPTACPARGSILEAGVAHRRVPVPTTGSRVSKERKAACGSRTPLWASVRPQQATTPSGPVLWSEAQGDRWQF